MSRKGKSPIQKPKNVEATLGNEAITIKGPKGALTQKLPPFIQIDVADESLSVLLADTATEEANFHGLYRSLVANMVKGVSEGFTKTLEMIGVGYRAAVKGNCLDLQVGLSHPTEIPIPEGLAVEIEKNNVIHIQGADWQQVGQFAARIRSIRPPEPYQGKGIRYRNEHIRRKAGKSAAKK